MIPRGEEVVLPGGTWRNGLPVRTATFRPLDGRVELAVDEAAADERRSRPERVTAALAAALERVGDEPVAPDAIDALTVADRQVLMRRLAAGLGRARPWVTARCGGCGSPFDVPVDEAALPVRAAQAAEAEVRLDDGRRLAFRLPTGADQAAILPLSGEAAVRALLARLLVAPAEADIAGLSPADLARIDAAIEAVGPAAVTDIATSCPECGVANAVALDPYAAALTPGGLIEEVHRLASAYHWPESEILALPIARRRRYLAMIDRARGMTG